jgi:hypothetical protein
VGDEHNPRRRRERTLIAGGKVLLFDDSSTLASGPVASEFGPSLQTLAADESEVSGPELAPRRPFARSSTPLARRCGIRAISVRLTWMGL